MTIKGRRKEYVKEELLENILEEVNDQLAPLEADLLDTFEKPKLPIIFIVGAQRSGTTLLMQLLIHRFGLAYPSNFIARFWSCPYIGAKIYESFDFKEGKKSFVSDLGYTQGINGPHEFGYFWKRWFPWLAYEEAEYEKINYPLLQKELAAWQSIKNRPLVFKNLIYLTYHLNEIQDIFPNAFFLNIEREDIYTIQSTYQSRLRLYNSEEEWFGIKPKVYKEILSLPVIDQIVRQVCHIKKDIRRQLQQVPNNRYLNIQYSKLVKDPRKVLSQIKKMISVVYKLEINNEISSEMKNQNIRKIDKDIFETIKERYKNYVI